MINFEENLNPEDNTDSVTINVSGSVPYEETLIDESLAYEDAISVLESTLADDDSLTASKLNEQKAIQKTLGNFPRLTLDPKNKRVSISLVDDLSTAIFGPKTEARPKRKPDSIPPKEKKDNKLILSTSSKDDLRDHLRIEKGLKTRDKVSHK